MLEIAKYSAGIQLGINLSVKGTLALMDEMMNGEAGNHGVKAAQFGKRVFEIVGHNRYGAIVGKTPARRFQHGGRKINGHRFDIWMVEFDQGQQTPVSGAEIEGMFCGRRDKFEKRRLAFDPVRDRVGAAEIVERVFS